MEIVSTFSARDARMLSQQARYSYEQLSKVFGYDPQTGVIFRHDGRNCCAVTDQGYIVVRYRTTTFRAHRLAWLLYYGVWPSAHIDHCNGRPGDNRIGNLRNVTNQQNNFNNRLKASGNRSGYVGVSRRVTKCGRVRFRASISMGGRSITCGVYDTAEEASAAYQAAKRRFHTFEAMQLGQKKRFTREDAWNAMVENWHTTIGGP